MWLMLIMLLMGTVQEEPVQSLRPMNVDVSIIPPNVMQTSRGLEGFDIDLWEAIAKELDIDFTYRVVPFSNIFDGLKSGSVKVAIAGITVNAEREKFIDFSHHYMDSGLRILVPAENHSTSTMWTTASLLFRPDIMKSFLLFFIFIAIGGVALWIGDKGQDNIPNEPHGIIEGMWCAFATGTTVGYGDISPKRIVARITAVCVWMVGTLVIVSLFATISSERTLDKLQSGIRSPDDLAGKQVATLSGSTTVPVLDRIGAEVHQTTDISQAYQSLIDGEVEAVVYDAPALMYYASNGGKGRVELTGPLFDPQYYGIAFPQGSELREQVNITLLKLKDDGTYDDIYQKWFGE